jgi:5-methylthioadenosine/S-adenosylhomocysteine deaminase
MSVGPAGTEFLIRSRALLKGVGGDNAGEVIEAGGLHVRDGVIQDIGVFADLRRDHPDLPVEGDANAVAFPGLVNGHHHSGLTPLQLGVPYGPLETWLPQFRGMRYVGHRLDTLYSAIEMLEAGVTTVQHIHPGLAGPEKDWSFLSDSVIGAYREIGMRVSFSFMIRDRNQLVHEDDDPFLDRLPEDLAGYWRPKLAAGKAPIAAHMDWFSAQKSGWFEADPDFVSWQLAPANLHWCSDDTLVAIFDTARRSGSKVHMHLVETHLQAEFARRHYGKSAVRHLADLGCLGDNLTLGHGIWVDDDDLNLIAGCGCSICHNASSGLRLASGVAPVNAMLERGVRVALGIDQAGLNDDRDMLQEMRLVWALHREPGLATFRPSAGHVFRMATEHGAATTGFDGRIGRLDAGMAADVVLVDWGSLARPFIDERVPLVDALLQRSRQMAADTVFVGGAKLVAGGKVVSIDREAVLSEISDVLSSELTPDEREARRRTQDLLVHVSDWFNAAYPPSRRAPYRFNALAERSDG